MYYTIMMKKSQIKFFIYFITVFIIIFILLYSAGLVPESIKSKEENSLITLWDKAQKKAIDNQLKNNNIIAESPTRIVIEKIGVDSTVSNPNSTKVSVLDEYLKKGAVRYPGSGLIGSGNMFIFGHSTSLKTVNNQAYKTFNNLRNLKIGDDIKVYGEFKVYTYRVSSVVLVDEKQALVKFDNKNKLTLSTCNTFGEKSERYVVEADFVY